MVSGDPEGWGSSEGRGESPEKFSGMSKWGSEKIPTREYNFNEFSPIAVGEPQRGIGEYSDEAPDVIGEAPAKTSWEDLKVQVGDEAKGTIAECTTNEFEDKIWNNLWALWKTPDQNGPLRAENIIETLNKNVHVVGLKDPSGAVLSAFDVPDGDFWSSVVQEAPIDVIDKPMDSMKRLVLVGGIIFGVSSGHLGMAYSCLKALLHYEAHRLSVAAIERLLPGDRSNSLAGNESPPSLKYAAMVEVTKAQRERAARAELERIRQRRAARVAWKQLARFLKDSI